MSTGQWYHLAFVRSGTSIKIYINGVDRTTSAASHSDPASSSDNFVVGVYPNGAPIYMNGLIDDFAIFTTNLSPTQVLAIYNRQK